MTEESEFKLIGYTPYSEHYPAPVVLVFDVHGKAAVQICETDGVVTSFDPVPNNYIDRVKEYLKPDIDRRGCLPAAGESLYPSQSA